MKFNSRLFWLLMLIILLILLIWYWWSHHADKKDKTIANWVNWNLIFKEGTDSVQRANAITKITAEIAGAGSAQKQINDSLYPFAAQLRNAFANDPVQYKLMNVRTRQCSCGDSLFWNIEADLNFDSSGPSQPVVTHPPSRGRVSGDLIEELSINEKLSNPERNLSPIDPLNKLNFPAGFSFMKNAFVSVIDTGIDTTLLDPAIRKAILPFGPAGSVNVITGADPKNLSDDHPIRHGTDVSSIILNQFYQSSGKTKLPQIMMIKAMDSTGEGDLFSLICGLSYSIRNHASLINISAGFTGETNSTLNYYLHLGKKNNIPVVAAAGNADEPHDNSTICNTTANTINLLKVPGRMVYPACMSIDEENCLVVCVTGMRSPGVACYLQNYSPQFVSVGVVNDALDSTCCSFKLPFFHDGLGVEGSSFATPVVSGRLAYSIMNGTTAATVSGLLNILNAKAFAGPGGVPVATKTFVMN